MNYADLLNDVKSRIRQAQTKATLAVNAEMLMLYWDIGRIINLRQGEEGWGSGIIPRLATDIRNELPELKGFSERNLKRMLSFYREYGNLPIVPQAVAQLAADTPPGLVPRPVAQFEQTQKLYDLAFQLPWGHNIILIEKVKDLAARLWYMEQTVNGGWSRDTLAMFIRSEAFSRRGQAANNFSDKLPSPQSELAASLLKDPYIFDFLTIEEPFHERELETELIRHVEKFLLELGSGFAFVGRQYHLDVGEQDFYIDLLFYHLKLRCFVVIDLKRGPFKPEYAGKLSFYCSVVDDYLRHDQDQKTIGLILCQNKNKVMAEYALSGIRTPLGISDYTLTKALPKELKSSLPSIEEIEEALGSDDD
ncbi:PDDEXK nuclease domain-containing protein [Deltaproteobacteria bacterium OttesenSCG-928-K17]|nr:PDDEXK nuclease domain-containing protein [Deltaproteobacteria bacterium OttesenSCG-928-K17]